MQIEHWTNISLTSYLWSQLTRVVHMLKQKCTVDEPKVFAMYLNNSVQRLVPWWLLTWLLVSTLLRHDPVFAFQNLIWRSAVPPPLVRTFGCHGHQAKAYIKKYTSYTQGQIVGARESLTGRKNMARRKVKNGEKSPWGQCLTRPVPNGRRRSAFWLGR